MFLQMEGVRLRSSFYAKLKPGPGYSAEEVRASQRARIHRAMIELVAERGYAGVTVRGLARTSEISTRSFYAQFANVEECFGSTYRSIMRSASWQLAESTAASSVAGEGLRIWVRTLTGSVAESPHPAKMAMVDCYDGGPAMLREIEAATVALERQLSPPSAHPTPQGQGIVAGVERVLRARLLEDRQRELISVADELADWVLDIYGLDPAPTLNPVAKGAERLQPRPLVTRNDPAFAVFDTIGGDRGRILATLAKQSAVRGYWNLTLPNLRREAGVTKKKFDALFGGIDSAYLEATEILTTKAALVSVEAAESAVTWRGRIERIASRFCDVLSRSPLSAQLAFVDVFAPGSESVRRRDCLLTSAADWAHRTAPFRCRPTGLAAEASAAACWRVLQTEVAASARSPQMKAPPVLAQLTLAPSRTPIGASH